MRTITLFSVLLLVAAGAQAHAPTGQYLDRTLELSATVGDTKVELCSTIKAHNSVFITLDMDYEMSFGAMTAEGKSGFASSFEKGFVPDMPPPPPADPQLAFAVVEGGAGYSYCQSYDLADTKADVIYAQSAFESWYMPDNGFMSDAVSKLEGKAPYIGRPLRRDEPLYSNYCRIDRVARTATCDGVVPPASAGF